jgi:glyoxylase-like metal-dependent hydrolase (beta-lactamase superfamily II)
MINIQIFAVNPFQENSYVLYDETKQCIIVDPGFSTSSEQQQLTNFIEKNNLVPKRLINTHCHIDHVLGNKFVADTFGLELEANELEISVLASGEKVSHMYGIPYEQSPDIQKFLAEEYTIEFGNSKLSILFCPGHSPGSLVFYNAEQKFAIGGDVLFYGSIGRTDLPGGHHETLINSIKTKLMVLPGDVEVYPGHGPKTTIEFEKNNNPFL